MSSDETRNRLEHLTDVYRAYFCPVVAILGMFGNIGIIVTFAYNFNNKFVIYCCALAFYNFIALLTNTFMDDFLGRGLAYLTNNTVFVYIELLSQGCCLFMEYVPNVMYFSASYIMVAFSLDRTLVIAMPVKYSPYRGYKSIIVICVGVGVMGAIVASPLLFTFTLELVTVNGTEFICNLTNKQAGKFGLYLKSVVIFVIPTILVATLNLVICFLLLKVNRKRRHLSIRKSPRNSNSEMGRIVTHLALSTVFLLLSIPLSITIILRLILPEPSMCDRQPENPLCNADYVYTVTHLSKLLSSVKDLSYAMNFLLYLIFIPSFKYEFLSVFRCRHTPMERNASLSLTTKEKNYNRSLSKGPSDS